MRVDNVEAFFNMYKAIQLSSDYEDLAIKSMVEKDEERSVMGVYLDDTLEKSLM